jgi:hypothetical protein
MRTAVAYFCSMMARSMGGRKEQRFKMCCLQETLRANWEVGRSQAQRDSGDPPGA